MDKFVPVSGGGDMDHAEEAFCDLVLSGRDGAVDFQASEEAFDMVSFTVERPVMFDHGDEESRCEAIDYCAFMIKREGRARGTRW